MSICKHYTWLKLRRKGTQVVLEASDRPQRLMKEIGSVDEPLGTVLLLGSQTKDLLRTTLCVNRGIPETRAGHSECQLYFSRLHEENRVLVFDGGLPNHNRLPVSCKPHTCHEVATGTMVGVVPRAVDAVNEMYSRIVVPLVDVICIFVADSGGMCNTLQHLKIWAGKGVTSTSSISPALLLVVPKGQESEAASTLSSVLEQVGPKSLSCYFQSIRMVSLPNGTKKLRQCHLVRKELLLLIKEIQTIKRQAGWLFSALHVTEFLRAAANAATSPGQEHFDLIKASRKDLPLSEDLRHHLLRFLAVYDDSKMLEHTLPLIASSFILDQYPPGMHRRHLYN